MWDDLDSTEKIRRITSDDFLNNQERVQAYKNLCQLQQDLSKPGKIFESISYPHVLYYINKYVPPTKLQQALDVLEESIIDTLKNAVLQEEWGTIKIFFQTAINNNNSPATLKFPKTVFKKTLVQQCLAIEILGLLYTLKKSTHYNSENVSTWIGAGYENICGTTFQTEEDIFNFFHTTFENVERLQATKNIIENMDIPNKTKMLYQTLKQEIEPQFMPELEAHDL